MGNLQAALVAAKLATVGQAVAIQRHKALENALAQTLRRAQRSGKTADWAKYAQLKRRAPQDLRASL